MDFCVIFVSQYLLLSMLWAAQVKLKHKETGVFLSSSGDKRYGRPIGGQLEICGKKKAGKGEEWVATEGLYFPERADSE